MQRRIFEAFAQADGTTARQYGGTGLGLSISRELVRLLGGEIALVSTPEQGSTFTVYLPSLGDADVAAVDVPAPATLPAHAALAVKPSPPRERKVGAGLAGMKALVVDDDFRNIFALTTLLERGQLEVVSAESGEEGVAILKRTPDIDIVLVDIMMPVMDGYATIRAMRELPWRAHLPIIALTANVAPGERQRCIDAGASEYVSKPVDTADLLLILGEWLPATAAGGTSSRLDQLMAAALQPVEAPGAAVLVVDDDAGKRLAIQAMLAPLGYAVVEADSGRAALRAVLRQPFAVILMDVRMPTLDGYETAKLIRQRTEFGRTPIIFVTAFGVTRRRRRTRMPAAPSTSSSRRSIPDVLRAKVAAFVDLFLQTDELKRSLESITDLNAALRDSEVRARAVLQNVADAIVTAGEAGLIESFNRSARRLFGYREDEVVGQPLS